MNEVKSAIMIGNLFSENTTVLNFIEMNNDLKKNILGELHQQGEIDSFDYPLINQGVFLSAAYISFVWLYEFFAKKNKNLDSALVNCLDKIGDFPEISNNHLEDGRKTEQKAQFLRTIRNAISHANVSIDFESTDFIFTDKYSKSKSDHAKLIIPMKKVGEISQKLLYAYNGIAKNA